MCFSMKELMTFSWNSTEREKQIVLRASRLMRVRRGRLLRSIRCVKIWQPEFTDKILSRKHGAVHFQLSKSSIYLTNSNRALRDWFLCFLFVLALALFLTEFTADSAEVILFMASSNRCRNLSQNDEAWLYQYHAQTRWINGGKESCRGVRAL